MPRRKWAVEAYGPGTDWVSPVSLHWTERGAYRTADDGNLMSRGLGFRHRYRVVRRGGE